MAKKKSGVSISKICLALGLLLGVAAICMMFVTSVEFKGLTYTGLQTAFGYTKETDVLVATAKTEVFAFSFMNLLTYILALAGVVLCLLNMLAHKSSKLFAFVSAAAFIVSAVFFFLTPQFSIPMMVLGKSVQGSVELALGIGSILGGVFSGIAGLSTLASCFVK